MREKRIAVMGSWIGLFAAICLLLTGVVGIAQSTQDAADWLEAQQDAAGWFPWLPGGGPTRNTQGPSALGLLSAYVHTGLLGFLDASLLSGSYVLDTLYAPGTGVSNWSDGTPRIAMHDPLFLEAMTLVTGDDTYSDFANTYYWEPLASGTYGDPDYSAESLGAFVVSVRGALSPWDMSATAIAAHLAGKNDVRDEFIEAIEDGLEATTSPGGWDVIGLAGAVWASAVTGVDLAPTAGVYAGMNTDDLAAELAGMTTSDNQGAWLWSSTADPDDPTNGDLQNTAFAIMALYATDAEVYEEQIAHGVAFIRSLQLGDGAFDIYPGAGFPYVESHAEALTAIVAVSPYIVYVSAANVGLAWGDDPDGEGIVIGYDAFADLAGGIDGVRPGGLVEVAHGDYDATYPITKPVTVVSEEGSASNTSLTGDMTLSSEDILLGRIGQGFSVYGNITVSAGVDATTVSINWNDLYGHVTNEGDGTLDARYNWWANRHPQNATTGDVDYTPFLPRPVDEILAFMERVGLGVDNALALLEFFDMYGATGQLAWELAQLYDLSLDEALELIVEYGYGRVSRAMGKSQSYEDFAYWLLGYEVTPAGGAGTFVDRAVAGGAGSFEDMTIDAVYEIGQPIVVSFSLEDHTGQPVTQGGVTVALIQIKEGPNSLVYANIIPYDEALGLYYLEIPTDALEAGHYFLLGGANDGSSFRHLLELVGPA